MLDKRLSKPLARILNKMLLVDSTLVGIKESCQILFKLIPTISDSICDKSNSKLSIENINKVFMVNPILPIPCINCHFNTQLHKIGDKGVNNITYGKNKTLFGNKICLDIICLSDSIIHNVLRSYYPKGNDIIVDNDDELTNTNILNNFLSYLLSNHVSKVNDMKEKSLSNKNWKYNRDLITIGNIYIYIYIYIYIILSIYLSLYI
jgi:hypothetical protein